MQILHALALKSDHSPLPREGEAACQCVYSGKRSLNTSDFPPWLKHDHQREERHADDEDDHDHNERYGAR
eukprot:685906-Rhodomonas_salina.2